MAVTSATRSDLLSDVPNSCQATTRPTSIFLKKSGSVPSHGSAAEPLHSPNAGAMKKSPIPLRAYVNSKAAKKPRKRTMKKKKANR
jgi:hypothetical protein